MLEDTPSAHIVGKTPDDKYYEVAICARYLCDIFHDFEFNKMSSEELNSKEPGTPFQHDVWNPTQDEIGVHGNQGALVMARNRFVGNAVQAITSAKHGRGLDQYYLSIIAHTDNGFFSVAIRWAILLRDLKACGQQLSPGRQVCAEL